MSPVQHRYFHGRNIARLPPLRFYRPVCVFSTRDSLTGRVFGFPCIFGVAPRSR